MKKQILEKIVQVGISAFLSASLLYGAYEIGYKMCERKYKFLELYLRNNNNYIIPNQENTQNK